MHRLTAQRVISSRRIGSSWPVEVETEDGRYFMKLSGSGMGFAALVAEVIVAGLGEKLGLPVIAPALVALGPDLISENRDPELLDLLASSEGWNLGIEVLAGARAFEPQDAVHVSSDDASRIVWLDWWVMNPDRTVANPNLLFRRGKVWLIDHGSALVFQHDWAAVTEDSPNRPWSWPHGHALQERASAIREWDLILSDQIQREDLEEVVDSVPDQLLLPLVAGDRERAHRRRAAYAAFLWKRLRMAERPWSQVSVDPGS